MDWQIAPGVPSSQIVKRTLCLDFANDGYPNASCNSSESNLLRNMDEVLKVMKSWQKSSNFKVVTPTKWKPGD
ncbi:hypothetical protein JHK87_018412 [Glycine soja]|nr:hypothetical protein JHK87_018412 [Glycine soja]